MEDELIEHALPALARFEGNVPWMYCDLRGNVTVGIGHLLADRNRAAALEFCTAGTDERVSGDVKAAAWEMVKASFLPGARAEHYRDLTGIRFDKALALRICRMRLLAEFIPALERLFPVFWSWPLSARLGMLDMVYSLGAGKLERVFVNLVSYARAGDWAECATSCHRRGGSEARNAWTAEQFLAVAAVSLPAVTLFGSKR